MVFDAASRNQSPLLIPKYSAQIFEEFRLDGVGDGWHAIFGAEDEMEIKASKEGVSPKIPGPTAFQPQSGRHLMVR